MKSITFYLNSSSQLIMKYHPEQWPKEQIIKKIKEEDGYNLRKCLHLREDNIALSETDEMESDDGPICFVVGEETGNGYIRLDKKVFQTEHDFFFSKDIEPKVQYFIAHRNISILKHIDDVVSENLYIDSPNSKKDDIADEEANHIPFDIFKEIIEQFPNSHETYLYSNYRIANIVKEYFPQASSKIEQFNRYTSNRTVDNVANLPSVVAIKENTVNLLVAAREELGQLMKLSEDMHSETISEREWQLRICQVVKAIYPKYILAKRDRLLGAYMGHDRCPDFILVDSLGFVDILEIKRPDNFKLLARGKQRENYIPSYQFSGVIEQAQKYVTAINYNAKEVEKKLETAFKDELPDSVKIQVVHPHAMILAGRRNGLDNDQIKDLEIIKRQYRDIIDIMTYDDLCDRIDNAITAAGLN